MQEEIKEPLPKNMVYCNLTKTYFARIMKNRKLYNSKKCKDITSAKYFADVMIKENELQRDSFLSKDDFDKNELLQAVYVATEKYFKEIKSINIKNVMHIHRTCICGVTKLIPKTFYKKVFFVKHYPDTEYYRCAKCSHKISHGEIGIYTTMRRENALKKKSHNTSGFVGIQFGKNSSGNQTIRFFVRYKHGSRTLGGVNATLEEMVWLRDDYIRHMGFDNILNLTDEEYFAQEFKYKFNKKIDWRKNEI